eukprot:g13668.t1
MWAKAVWAVASLAVVCMVGVGAKRAQAQGLSLDAICEAMNQGRAAMEAAEEAGNDILRERAERQARETLRDALEAALAESGGPGLVAGWVVTLEDLRSVDDGRAVSFSFEAPCDILLRSPIDEPLREAGPLFEALIAYSEGDEMAIVAGLRPAGERDAERGLIFEELSITESGAYREPEFVVDLFALGPPSTAEQMAAEAASFAEQLAAFRANQAEAKRAAEAVCRRDLACWTAQHREAAEPACIGAIERSLSARFEWTNSWLESRLTHSGWENEETGVLKYAGDALEVQSGGGGWVNVIYLCRYDPATGEAFGGQGHILDASAVRLQQPLVDQHREIDDDDRVEAVAQGRALRLAADVSGLLSQERPDRAAQHPRDRLQAAKRRAPLLAVEKISDVGVGQPGLQGEALLRQAAILHPPIDGGGEGLHLVRVTPYGRQSAGDPKFLANLAAGRGVSLRLIEKAERFMAENPVDGFSLAGTVFDPAPAAPAPDTKIEWAEARWNPVRVRLVGPDGAALTRPDPKTGEVRSWWGYHCEHVSPGCEHCYAETLNKRGFPAFGTLLDYKPGLIDGPLPPAVWGRLGVPHGSRLELYLDEDELRAPLRWRKPRTIFVCSMTDLFARFVPDAMIDRVFAVMAMAPQHTFQVLTKRAEAMRAYLSRGPLPRRRWEAVIREAMGRKTVSPAPRLRNVWLGVSVEDQRRADDRRAPLAALAAAGWPTWVSYEPALGPHHPEQTGRELRVGLRLRAGGRDAAGGGRGPAILDQPLDSQGERLLRADHGLLLALGGRDAAGKVGKGDAEGAVGLLMQKGGIIASHDRSSCGAGSGAARPSAPSAEPQAGLPFDALQGPDRYVARRMRHSHAAGLGRVLELHVIAALTGLPPSVRLEGLDHHGGRGAPRAPRPRRRRVDPAAEAEAAARRKEEARRIRDMLAARTPEVLGWLMPGAAWRKSARYWRCGGIHGGEGSGFRVRLSDGTWRDFSAGPGGSLIDLIQAVRGGTVKDAFDAARAFLGLDDESAEGRRRAKQAADRAEAARRAREAEAARRAADTLRRVQALWGAVRGRYCTRDTPAGRYFREVRRIDAPTPCRFGIVPYWDASDRDAPPWRVGDFPCVITPFVGAGRTIRALHLTYLDPDPPHGKLDLGLDANGDPLPAKKFLGAPPPDAALRLTVERPVMAVGEGIETVQTAIDLRAGAPGPAWGGRAAGAVDRLEFLTFGPTVERIVVLGERGCAPAKGPDGAIVRKPDGTPLIPAEEATRRAAQAYAALPHRPTVELKWFQGDLNDDVENRDWATRHRGPLLIHAGRTYDADAEGFIEGASGVAVPRTQSAGPAGALIGAARLVECVTSHPGPWFFGRYGFVLEDPILFGRPIRWAGPMTVYVDDMRARFGRLIMCHMIADSAAELLAMADRIGVARRWLQNPGGPDEHFDIALSKRARAVQAGAVEITQRQLGAMVMLRRMGLPMGEPETAQERAFAEALARALEGWGFAVEREVRLGPGERVDIMLADRIAVEVKVKRAWSKPAVLRQLRRYAAHERVAGLILATNLAMHLPAEIGGKPALIASLGRAWL